LTEADDLVFPAIVFWEVSLLMRKGRIELPVAARRRRHVHVVAHEQFRTVPLLLPARFADQVSSVAMRASTSATRASGARSKRFAPRTRQSRLLI
jgi:hypothetical protein